MFCFQFRLIYKKKTAHRMQSQKDRPEALPLNEVRATWWIMSPNPNEKRNSWQETAELFDVYWHIKSSRCPPAFRLFRVRGEWSNSASDHGAEIRTLDNKRPVASLWRLSKLHPRRMTVRRGESCRLWFCCRGCLITTSADSLSNPHAFYVRQSSPLRGAL